MSPPLEPFSALATLPLYSCRQRMSLDMRFPTVVFTLACSLRALSAEPGWWMIEPIRWIQTNLPETDAALNPQEFVGQIADYDGNVLLMTMGEISAYYPSRVQ